jgi:hypothetical protein
VAHRNSLVLGVWLNVGKLSVLGTRRANTNVQGQYAMKTLYRSSLSLIGALVVAGSAYGQQPPDVVTSDASFNTAMGTDALLHLTPISGPPLLWLLQHRLRLSGAFL